MFLLALLMLLLPAPADAGSDPACYTRDFNWRMNKRRFHLSLDFSWDSHDFHTKVPRVYGQYGVYSFEHPAHAIVPTLTAKLQATARRARLGEWGAIRLAVSFVQNLRYQPEPGEYPKFPYETLSDRGGDCEDLSILLAAILREMGYATVLVNPPGHMAVALSCQNCEGVHFPFAGKRLFYIETTSPTYEIGEAPEKYARAKGKLFATDNHMAAAAYLERVTRPVKAQAAQFYLREDEHRLPLRLGSERLVAAAKVQSMQVNGTRQRMSMLTGIGENDSAILPPLAWAATQRQTLLPR